MRVELWNNVRVIFSSNSYEVTIHIVCICVNIFFFARVELLKKPKHINLTYPSSIVAERELVSYEHIDLTPKKCHIDHKYHKSYRFVGDMSQNNFI